MTIPAPYEFTIYDDVAFGLVDKPDRLWPFLEDFARILPGSLPGDELPEFEAAAVAFLAEREALKETYFATVEEWQKANLSVMRATMRLFEALAQQAMLAEYKGGKRFLEEMELS